jgi:ATP-dependent protease Clp ATPase subunit
MPKTAYCSFCGKAEAEVFYIVEGPANAGICDECVVLATDVIQRQRGSVARGGPIIRKKRSLAEFRAELRDQR